MSISAKACIFDVFGTVVNTEGSLARQLAVFASSGKFITDQVDWLSFAREWIAEYEQRT
jgi:hypothetical protein